MFHSTHGKVRRAGFLRFLVGANTSQTSCRDSPAGSGWQTTCLPSCRPRGSTRTPKPPSSLPTCRRSHASAIPPAARSGDQHVWCPPSTALRRVHTYKHHSARPLAPAAAESYSRSQQTRIEVWGGFEDRGPACKGDRTRSAWRPRLGGCSCHTGPHAAGHRKSRSSRSDRHPCPTHGRSIHHCDYASSQ